MDPDIDKILALVTKRAKELRFKDKTSETVANQPVQLSKADLKIPLNEEVRASGNPEPVADIALVVALGDTEAQPLQDAFGKDWIPILREGILFKTTTSRLNNDDFKIVLAVQDRMGMVPAAILATKTLITWRPLLIAMTGICAGVKGRVELGSIVVAQQLIDYDSGKIEAGKLSPRRFPVQTAPSLVNIINYYANDAEFLAKIRESWPLPKVGRPNTDLKAHVGSFGTGASVVKDEHVVKNATEHQDDLIAIDMEGYAIASSAYAAAETHFLVIKGVQDFADPDKKDTYRHFCSYVSAQFLHRVLDRHASQIISNRRRLYGI